MLWKISQINVFKAFFAYLVICIVNKNVFNIREKSEILSESEGKFKEKQNQVFVAILMIYFVLLGNDNCNY